MIQKTNNLIIDGTNLEFRAFNVAKKSVEFSKNGERKECIKKFLQMFKGLLERFSPDNIYVAWDKKITKDSTNFRKDELNDTYKAGRTKPDDVKHMYQQEEKLIQILESFGCKNMFPNVLEADDVIAWVKTQLDGTIIIVSVDHDLYQLVDDRTSIYNLKALITKENFEETVGVPVENFLLYKAIMGDTSDNIAGIPSYGKKRSAKLSMNWGNSHITEEYKKIVERNLKLMDLSRGYLEEEQEIHCYETQNMYLKTIKGNFQKFYELCENYNIDNVIHEKNYWQTFFTKNKLIDLIAETYK